MIYTPLTKKAMRLAYFMHRDQTDKGGLPYIFHPFHLAEQMTTEETTVVALLHDVVEDTSCTIRELAEQGYPKSITDALLLLTHDRSVPYMEYIKRISANPIARAVKLADLRHNSDLTRLEIIDEKARTRAEKYRKAIELLTEEDGEMYGDGQFTSGTQCSVHMPEKEKITRTSQERDQACRRMGCQKDASEWYIRPKENVHYYRLSNGVLLKIDRENLTCYRFDPEHEEWNSDSVLFSEYEHGNLDGERVSFTDVYPIGAPFVYRAGAPGGNAEDRRRAFPDPQTLRSRITASLYGGALGDALGYEIEFDSWQTIQARFGRYGIESPVLHNGKAQVSDDTQMTLFTAEGIGFGYFRAKERGIGGNAADYTYQAYLCWLQTQGVRAESLWDPVSSLMRNPEMNHRRAPGNTCLSALRSGKKGTIWEPINRSKGCGGVMRAAPLGFVRQTQKNESPFGQALKNGVEAAAITHGHPLGWLPAGMLADMIDRCIYGAYASLKELMEASLAAVTDHFREFEEAKQFAQLMTRAIELGTKAEDEERHSAADEAAIRSLGEGWVGDEALAIAVYSVLRYPRDLKKALVTAVNHGGDSDSTGAIAGNILGAYLGMDAIPKDWSMHLELTDAIDEIVNLMMRVIEDA